MQSSPTSLDSQCLSLSREALSLHSTSLLAISLSAMALSGSMQLNQQEEETTKQETQRKELTDSFKMKALVSPVKCDKGSVSALTPSSPPPLPSTLASRIFPSLSTLSETLPSPSCVPVPKKKRGKRSRFKGNVVAVTRALQEESLDIHLDSLKLGGVGGGKRRRIRREKRHRTPPYVCDEDIVGPGDRSGSNLDENAVDGAAERNSVDFEELFVADLTEDLNGVGVSDEKPPTNFMPYCC